LRPLLAGRRTLLLGQSGMGKSTLVNLLVPGAEMATQAISEVLNAGRHTTTFTRAFELPHDGGWLIDSPGFQLFGLSHLSASEIEHGLREFQPLLGGCRYYNCTHLHEPGCAIRDAVASGRIDKRRYAIYSQLRR
jgi:ribosome biogenesis GTPase / thiamine phosphate phosphatase